jgi:hypothetical protein
MNKTFLKEFCLNLVTHTGSSKSIKQVMNLYLVSSLRQLFKNLNVSSFTSNQILGIIFKLEMSDGAIVSISTFRKGDKTSFVKFSTLFKQLLNSRVNDYSDRKVTKIIFNYHIFDKSFDNLSELEQKSIISDKTSTTKTHIENNIKYMETIKIFKIPLSFAGSN